MGSKEHPRPCHIKRELDEKKRECVPRAEVCGNRKMRHTENAINTKSVVQTGAKIQFGGLKEGLASPAYQGARLGYVAS